MITRPPIQDLLQKRILVFGGVMGTSVQAYGLSETDFRGKRLIDHPCELKGNNDILSLTQPQLVSEIHRSFLDAGVDFIQTNTFNANALSQSHYGTESFVYELNHTSAKLAVTQADESTRKTPLKPRYVVGIIGPSRKSASLSSDPSHPGFRDVTFDSLVSMYTPAIAGLVEGGVHLLMIETIFDTLNAKACIYAIRRYLKKNTQDIPLMLSCTISDTSGRTLLGQTPAAFCISVSHAHPVSIGINCSLGAREMRPYLVEMSKVCNTFLSVHPNAGLPDSLGKYTETPHDMALLIRQFALDGLVNIVGGCCGTTPDHLKAIVEAVAPCAPRSIPQPDTACRLAGLEPLFIRKDSLFVNIGERTNVAGSQKFAQAIRQKDYGSALSIARQQVENGAQIIDINLDDAMLDAESEIATFLSLLAGEPDIIKVPIMVDSSRWSVLEAGLKCLQGKGIVNSLSLKEGEHAFLEKAETVADYGAAVVVMCFDEQGQADTFQRRIQIAERAYTLLRTKARFAGQDIIIDPNIFAIGTGLAEHAQYAVDYIESVKYILAHFENVYISGGVSNLSFAFRGNNTVREAMHAVFLYHAIASGMSMGIVNAGQLPVYEEIPVNLRQAVEDLIFNRRPDASDRLLEIASTSKTEVKKQTDTLAWRSESLHKRIATGLMKGISDFIEQDVDQAVQEMSAMDIIEGPLLDGMRNVGDLFGAGKMFLPQVIKSARVMKVAVNRLLPILQQQQKTTGTSQTRGILVLATVKGDVHDIGKNIVSVVLQCNNYTIIDLGVMVPAQKIIETALAHHATMIGVSGLITPSLEEMVYVAQLMEESNLQIPLLIGGATTSKVHTAVKIAKAYSGPVIHVKDASKAAEVCSALTSRERSGFVKTLQDEYETIRTRMLSHDTQTSSLSLIQARERRLRLNWNEYIPPQPAFIGKRIFLDTKIHTLTKYIDWRFFLKAWQLPPRYPQILSDPTVGDQVKKLIHDARTMLDVIESRQLLKLAAGIAFFPAFSTADDCILLYTDQSKEQVKASIPCLRQQTEQETPNLSLSDFIAPIESALDDYCGVFAATAGLNIEASIHAYEKEHDDYSAIMIKILADRLSEAYAEYLHELVRKEFWGYAPSETVTPEEMFQTKYRGIRPAPGYGTCPDHSLKQCILETLLESHTTLGIELTESYMMVPQASVCGYYFSHPESRYFSVGRIQKDQLQDYSQRSGMSQAIVQRLIGQ